MLSCSAGSCGTKPALLPLADGPLRIGRDGVRPCLLRPLTLICTYSLRHFSFFLSNIFSLIFKLMIIKSHFSFNVLCSKPSKYCIKHKTWCNLKKI